MREFIVPAPSRPVEPVGPPTFSVVIAAYQAADTIGEAIESVLGQTVPPREVIVCDDGSEDDLAVTLAPYRDEITCLRQENRGAASARNAATRAATGEFVAILDADDIFLPERIEALGALAAFRPDLDILATDAWYVQEGRRAGRFNGTSNPFPAQGQRTEILQRCFLGGPAVRRRVLGEAGGWDESLLIAEDWDCWMRLILGGARAGLVAEPLLEYRLGSSSLSDRRVESFRARVRVLEKNRNHPALRRDERPILAAALSRHRRNLMAIEAEEATVSLAPEARQRWLAIARESAIGKRARFRAAALAVLPAPIARAALNRARRAGRSRAAGRRPPA